MRYFVDDRIREGLSRCLAEGVIEERFENNRSLDISYRGVGGVIARTWNVKIYKSGSLVCVDMGTLEDLVSGAYKDVDMSLEVIQVDDAGWGYPLGGVMVGITDGKRMVADVVPVMYFQGPIFMGKFYLKAYSRLALKWLHKKFLIDKSKHRFEICTGYINKGLVSDLRELGFSVRVVEITGVLQDKLEGLFKQYIENLTGYQVEVYDPKEVMREGGTIGSAYAKVVTWGIDNAPTLLKWGWRALQKDKRLFKKKTPVKRISSHT